MESSTSTKYLGNYISSKGGNNDTIEDRRKKGWGKVSLIMGILGEVDMGVHKLEAGLLLRDSILVNSLLFSAEAWSAVSEKQLARLEVVDNALLRQLTGGHSKSPLEFNHLETSTLKLRHILSYRRIMFHHEILSREDHETIKKIYMKQKEDKTKGDWITLLEENFKFIGIDIKEEEICSIPKSEYKEKIKSLIKNAAFHYFIERKSEHKKLDSISYPNFQIQPYLTSSYFNNKERGLLYLLRSHCYKSKSNFRKLHRNSLECMFGCSNIEDQNHIFTNCQPITSKLNITQSVNYEYIFGTLDEQQQVISALMTIEETRVHMKQHLLPGGACSQDPCKFSNVLDYAADSNL